MATNEQLISIIRRLLSCDIDENINIDGIPGAISAARKAIGEPLPKDINGKEIRNDTK